MKYRKKPVVVDAEQFRGYYGTPYPQGVEFEDNGNSPERGKRYQFYVVTAHGQRANIVSGDWIIAEPDGRGYYPCKDSIFKEFYEPVNEKPSV